MGKHSRHGMCGTPTYLSWGSMISRCGNPKTTGYKDYGGRGIKVCARWKIFTNFLKDMGVRPERTSLHRIDNDKGYFKKNCKWASPKEQAQNKRGSVIYGGRIQSLQEWSYELQIPAFILKNRLETDQPFAGPTLKKYVVKKDGNCCVISNKNYGDRGEEGV